MGLFDSLFGPSWEERVAVYMRDQRSPLPERIRACVNALTPTTDLKEISQGLPVSEIRKCLGGRPDCEELGSLAMAMSTRKTMRVPVVAMKMKSETQWQISIITDRTWLPVEDGNRYRRYENDKFIIWNPVDDQGQDLAPCPK